MKELTDKQLPRLEDTFENWTKSGNYKDEESEKEGNIIVESDEEDKEEDQQSAMEHVENDPTSYDFATKKFKKNQLFLMIKIIYYNSMLKFIHFSYFPYFSLLWC